jgi:hypothetical protein
MIKTSLVVPLYQSWEILRRQVLYWNSLRLPPTIEVIIADDGSDPKPVFYDKPNFRYQLIHRENKQKGWTIPHILNFGARHARGLYIMFLGIDHIISPQWVHWSIDAKDDYAVFTRKCALLGEDGELLKIQYNGEDCDVEYTSIGWIKKRLFDNLGGFDEEVNGINKDVNFFKRVVLELKTTRLAVIGKSPAFVYMLPEKKDTQLNKGRIGEHWRWMSHLRPVQYLHRIADRHRTHRNAAELPYDPPEDIDERFSFVGLNGKKLNQFKFSNLVAWKYPAEVAWMLGEYR